MQKTQVFTQEWVSLNHELRTALTQTFGLQRDTCIEVDGGKVVCDGYSDRALARISVSAMQEFLNSTEIDFYELFIKTINKVNSKDEEEPIVEEIKESIEDIKGLPKKVIKRKPKLKT